ncbi:MAG: DUF4974 domain-containing protein [Tannerellaceae bacterium]|nr:DUF4974 domain-containing protein [Tannerellaceae bacterium]
MVELDGEAYFQVHPDTEKAFIVKTPQSSIQVLGMEFNVDAYSGNSVVTTTLVEGAVEFFFTDKYNREQVVFMQPNQQVIYEKEAGNARHTTTYVPKDIAWKNGQIILKETPLTEVLWILSKRFNVEFAVKNPAFYNYSFTGIFTNQQIERVLEHFKRSSYIKYKNGSPVG